MGGSELRDRCADRQQAGVHGKWRIADHPAQNQGVHAKTGAAACGAGRAAGVQKDGGLPLDVSVPGEGGSTDHARCGTKAASDDTGAGRLQACQIS